MNESEHRKMNQLVVELEAERDKWNRLHEKVKRSLINTTNTRDMRIIELERLSKGLTTASDDDLERASARSFDAVDEVRRADVLRFAFKNVDRWMTEGIPEDPVVSFEIKDVENGQQK